MKTRVIFEYDETAEKWEVFVTGETDPTVVRQAFNAVILTCQGTSVSMLHDAVLLEDTEPTFKIIPMSVDLRVINGDDSRDINY